MMKTMTIRNFVLSKNKKQAFYKGKEIIGCGVYGKPQYYWVDTKLLPNERGVSLWETHILYMAEPIQIID